MQEHNFLVRPASGFRCALNSLGETLRGGRRTTWPFVVALTLGIGCSDSPPEEQVQAKRAALSASVLAFENLADWSGPAGKLTLSDVRIEGQSSLLVTNGGAWTDVLSVPVGSIDGSPSAVSLKFRVSQAPASWETIQVTFDSPSRGLNWAAPPGNLQTLVSLNAQAEQWHTVTFSTGTLSAALAGAHDVRVRVSVNVAGNVRLDDMRFEGLPPAATGGTASGGSSSGGAGGGSTGGGTAGGGTAACVPSMGESTGAVGEMGTIVLRLPKDVSVDQVYFGALGGELDVDDGVRLEENPAGKRPLVAQVGLGQHTDIGAFARTGSVVSQSPVNLRSYGTVFGTVVSSGAVTRQQHATVNNDPVVNEGAIFQNVPLTPLSEVAIPYAFPAAMAPVASIQNGADVTLSPGGYQSTKVSGSTSTAVSTLRLGSGTYYFEELRVEPGSKLVIDNSGGAVLIFVRGLLHFAGTVEHTQPSQYNILYVTFDQAAVGGVSFRGTLVAPNWHLSLYSAPNSSFVGWHSGSFFAHSIRAHQWTSHQHVPFRRNDCASLCDCATAFGCNPSECPTAGTGGNGAGGSGGASDCEVQPTHPGCPQATCTNGVRDGNETGVDCGGSCGPCSVGEGCSGDLDCAGDLICGEGNGACFGLGRSERVCWDPTCTSDSAARDCGQVGSACGENCACVTPCDAEDPGSTCPSGEACVPKMGTALGASSNDACLPEGTCPSNDPALCGSPTSLCGAVCVCTPDCSAATCANPSDGCGGRCPAVCNPGETCSEDVDCPADYACTESGCRPELCTYRLLEPPLCGSPGAPCGEQCPACTPQCDGRSCGLDPNCGKSCGVCASGSHCTIDGQCVTPAEDPALLIPDGQGGTRPLDDLPPAATATVGVVPGVFSVTEQGQARYTIPIDVPPGRAGLEPKLALTYVGGKRNGEEGVGWTLQGLAKITRCPRIHALDGYARPIKGDSDDRFCLDGQRLMKVSAGAYGADGTEYRTIIDSFAKVVAHQGSQGPQLEGTFGLAPRQEQGPDSFEVWTKDGRILTFGEARDSIVMAANGVRHAWLLKRVADRAGNRMDVSYTNLFANVPKEVRDKLPNLVRPSAIAYTGHGTTVGTREVRLDYETRSDPGVSYLQGGVPHIYADRLSTITTYLDGAPVKNYRLEYGPGAVSQIAKVFECSGGDDTLCKAPTQFEYARESGFSALSGHGRYLETGARLDVNRDGIPDWFGVEWDQEPVPFNPWIAGAQIAADAGALVGGILMDMYVGYGSGLAVNILHGVIREPFFDLFTSPGKIEITHNVYIGTGRREDPFEEHEDVSGVHQCSWRLGEHTFMVDYDRDGRDDILKACPHGPLGGNSWSLYVSTSNGDGSFTSSGPVAQFEAGSKVALVDVDGNGLEDVVSCRNAWVLEARLRQTPTSISSPQMLLADLSNMEDCLDGGCTLPFCRAGAPYNVFDADGDGTHELVVRGRAGWSALRFESGQLFFEPLNIVDAGGSQDGVGLSLADFNGDGLADLWKSTKGKPYVWVNGGGGKFSLRTPARPTFDLKYEWSRAVDYDADGRDDLLERWTSLRNHNAALFFDGRVRNASAVWATDILMPNPTSGEPPLPGYWNGVSDVDGDGNVDLLSSGVYYGSGSKNGALIRVVDGLNNFVRVTYDDDAYETNTDCNFQTWPETCLKRVHGLVSEHTEGVLLGLGESAQRRYSYKYLNAHVNVTGHGWLGFEARTVRVSSTPDEIVATTIYPGPWRYRLDGTRAGVNDVPYVYALAGQTGVVTVERTPVEGATNPLLDGQYRRRSETRADWEVATSAAGLPYPRVYRRSSYDFDVPLNGGAGSGVLVSMCTQLLSNYDGYGNSRRSEENCQYTNANDPVESNVEVTLFEPNESDWLIAHPTQRIVQSSLGGQTSAQSWDFGYENGQLVTARRAFLAGSSQQHVTRLVRDAFGNVQQVVEEVPGEPSRTTSISYDADHIYPTTITNALGHVAHMRYDKRWGAQIATVDANGVAAQSAYDGFGRITASRDATGMTTYTHSWLQGSLTQGTQVEIERRGAEGTNGGWQLIEYDSLGRQTASRSVGLQGVEVLQRRQYDQRGRVVSETLPHAVGTLMPPVERYFYDHLDRVTKVEHADGSVAETHYATGGTLETSMAAAYLNGLTCGGGLPAQRCAAGVRRSVDENGQVDVVVTDHRGRVLRNIDGLHTTGSKTANYVYGPFGRLIEARDNEGTVTSFAHDPYGRMTSHTDPNSGESTFAYNGYDELVRSSEPGGVVRTFTYDQLGRRKTIVDAQGTTEWIYDQGVSGLGQLSGTVSPTGHTYQYFYEAATASRHRGLVERVEAVIEGTAYSFNLQYDDLGRTLRVEYPSLGTGAPIVAEYSYDNESGALTGLNEVGSSATRQLWHLDEAYQGYLAQRESFGSGATTTYSYSAERLWLTGLETTLNAAPIQSLEYSRQDNGQVHEQHTGAGGSSLRREYVYDGLSVLTSMTDFVEGAPPVTTGFSYDARGNLTAQASPESSTSFTYYPTRPHLLATVGMNGYTYDASGNLAGRSGPDIPGGTQTFEYTPFDLPTKITTGGVETELEYSADEKRVLRRDATQTRYFVTDLYHRVVDNAGNTLEERFRLNADGRLLGEIVRKPSGEQVLYFHTDHQGTVEVLSTDAGTSHRREYDVWGAPQFSASEELTRAGYTGHQHDVDLGLIDMRGRIYDPLARRFLTPDPVMQAPFWSQGLNRYSYVFNDPVNRVDPSGFASFNDIMSKAVGTFVALGYGASAVATAGGFFGWSAAGAGGTAAWGGGGIYGTVTDPHFGGAHAGASGTVSLSGIGTPRSNGGASSVSGAGGYEGASSTTSATPVPGKYLVRAGSGFYRLSALGLSRIAPLLRNSGYDVGRTLYRFSNLGDGVRGETDGNVVRLDTRRWNDLKASEQIRLLAHETAHAAQFHRLGYWSTRLRSVWESLKYGQDAYNVPDALLDVPTDQLDIVDPLYALEALAEHVADYVRQ